MFPSGTRTIDFRHDGDGGTVTLYEFTDGEAADQFAQLIEGDIFTSRRTAVAAFEEAADA